MYASTQDTQMHTCRHIYIGNISIRTLIHTYMYMNVQILCAEPHVNMHPQMHPLRHINVHACTHTEIHKHSCTHTHTHTESHIFSPSAETPLAQPEITGDKPTEFK